MEYRLTLIFFFLFVSVKYCSGQSFFPDSIPTSKLETTNRLKGTRLYLTIPASYKIRTRTTGVQEFEKDSLTGRQVIENVNQNFYQVKGEFLGRSFDIKNGDKGISKAVKVGGFDGVYYTGPFKETGQKATFLVFGDSSFTVIIDGGFLSSDKAAEKEINTILKTTAYEQATIVDPLELMNFKFDISITGFKYEPYIGMNELTYSSDGKITSLEEERHKSSIVVANYQSVDIENAKKIVKSRMEELTEFSLSKVSNVNHKNININGNAAYEMTMDEQGSSIADTKFYIVVIQKETMAVLFWGVDRDGGKWIEKFKATAQSIKFGH
jgi:hypothetical protein